MGAILKIGIDNSFIFKSDTAPEGNFKIEDITVLVPKEKYTEINIKDFIFHFSPNKEDGNKGTQTGDFKISIRNNLYYQGSEATEFINYYQCKLCPIGTTYLSEGRYFVTITKTPSAGSQLLNIKIKIGNIEEYKFSNPEKNQLELDLSNINLYYTSDNDNRNILIEFNNIKDTTDNINSLFACEPLVKMMNSKGEKHIVFLNQIDKITKDNIDYINVSWYFDSFAENAKDDLLFALCFINSDYTLFYETEVFNLNNNEVIDASSHSLYKEFKKWMNVNSFYLMEGDFELRDDENLIYITGRTINISLNQNTLVKNDNKSELITFCMDRYQDGIDISEKDIVIKYFNASNEPFRSKVVNKIVESTQIIFSWLITSNVTCAEGTVKFIIEISGDKDSEGKDWYLWQTLPASLIVKDTLVFPSDVPPDDPNDFDIPNWYQEILENIENLEEDVSNLMFWQEL